MGSEQRGSQWWLAVVAIAVASCGHGRVLLRFGSMKVSERSFDYSHGVESFKLPNGLTVALAPEPRANLVAVDVRYLTGAIEDPAGKSGLAHVVEHMMFERRTSLDGPTVGDVLAGAALYHNAGTSWDATHYQDIALADRLDDVLAIEAARMAGGCTGLDEAALERERAIVLQELAQRGPSEVVDAILGDVFGASHRYAAGVGGHDVARLTLDDVCGFLDAHYAPRRAILVVSGRFDAPRLRRTVIEKFGAITRKATGARAAIPAVTMNGETAEHRVDVDEAAAIVVFPAAPWGSPDAIDDALVDALLAGQLGELEREHRWITDVEAGMLGSQRNGARYFGISVDDPAHLDEAVAAIYRAASELPFDNSGRALGAIAARRQSQLFDQFESIAERGSQCANYLQFTDHRKFHLFDLAMLQDIDVGRLRARAARMTRGASQVVRVLPLAHHGSTARPHLAAASAAIDAPIWHDTVDPAEADRPLPLPLPADPRFTVSELQLANGMRVLLAPGFDQPVFEARVVFPVGDFNIGPDRAYLADAAADLLTHDLENIHSLKDFATLDWVMRLGTRLSASVDDATTFSARGTSTFADWHLWRLHWLLESGVYPEKDVEQANARATRPTPHRNTGRGWRRALREALFGRDHPFARALPTVPPTVSTGELEQFHDAHYRASGATLILVGKFDETALRKEVTELFGAWSAEPPPALPPMPPMHPLPGPTWIAHADPDANQVRITFAFAATSSRQPAQGGRAAIAEMLRSRLDQVRSRLGASYGIRTSYQWSDAGDIIAVDGYVDPGRAGEVLRRMLADLDGLRQGDAELAADFVRARRTALAGALAHPMQSDAVADTLESAVTHHAPIDTSSLRAAAIARTTLAEARAVIAADLQPQRMVVLLSGRPADTAAAFATAGISGYQRVADEPAPPP